jgi:molecular chaperone DnaK
VEKELNDLKEAIKSEDEGKIKQSMEALQKSSHKLAEEVYKATAAQQAGAGAAGASHGGAHQQGGAADQDTTGGGKPKGDDDVIDADFKAEDDKK